MWRNKYRICEENGGEGGDLGGDAGGEGGEGEVKPAWPDDWRNVYAGDDEKKLKQLERYTSPNAAFDALLAAKQRIRDGELRAPFPDKGTEEEQAAWRKENGLPESPDKYDLSFDNGLVVGDDDKPVIDRFLQRAHAMNMPPSQVKDVVQWYFQDRQEQIEAQNAADEQIAQETQDALRAEWGTDYRRNMNSITQFLDGAPEGVKDKMLNGRLADGTPIFSDPDTLRFLANVALEINPATTLTGGQGTTQGVADRLAEIQKMMGDRKSDYWKGPKSEKIQEEYRKLLEWQEKEQRKSA